MPTEYVPIDCGLHDELLLLALRGRPVTIKARTNDGHVEEHTAGIVDVVSRAGAEWLVIDGGTRIRLDRLVEVDGRPFAKAC